MENIGSRIKTARIKKGWTQKQLADAIEVTSMAVSRYETGNRTPDISIVDRIAEALDVSSIELFFGLTASEIIQEAKIVHTDSATLPKSPSDDDLEKWLDGEDSPFFLYHADEKVVTQKLLDVFSKLDRGWQVYLIEDAERYFERQEREKPKD